MSNSFLFGIISFNNLLIVAALSGAIVLGDLLFKRGARQVSGEAPPQLVSRARTVCAWALVIALFWWAIATYGLEFALVLGVVLTGVVYALDVWVLRGQRTASMGPDASEPPAVEYARSFFPVILLVLLVRSFLFEPFRIPSASMVPTLLVGDFIFVNKFSYGIRLPVVHSEVVSLSEPKRGDVVVFRLPSDERVNYIKRVVGLPGDKVSVHSGVVRINGERVDAEVLERYQGPGASSGKLLLMEQLGERDHEILADINGRGQPDRLDGDWVVPEGHYFMMGDNRDNSQDSRHFSVGFVPEENFVGRAEVVWLSVKLPAGFGIPGIRLGRFGSSIT